MVATASCPVSRSHLFAVHAAIGCPGDVSRITACPTGTWRNLRFRWNDSCWFMSPSRSRLPRRLFRLRHRGISIRLRLLERVPGTQYLSHHVHPPRAFTRRPMAVHRVRFVSDDHELLRASSSSILGRSSWMTVSQLGRSGTSGPSHCSQVRATYDIMGSRKKASGPSKSTPLTAHFS